MFKRLRLRRSAYATTEQTDDESNRGELTKARTSGTKVDARPMFATVCVNNVNRSMSAECVLAEAGLRVCSFGAGSKVSFPGKTVSKPRIFGFSTPYEVMYDTLRQENESMYTQNGVLAMLERDMRVKERPRRWQALRNKDLQAIDIVLCLDYGVYTTVLNDLQMRIRFSFRKKQLHLICLDIEDTPEDARSGSALALELCQEIEQLKDRTEAEVKQVIVQFEKRHQISVRYIGVTV